MASDLTILGGGSWGTALAIHLSRCGRSVTLWVHDPALADSLVRERMNAKYLPGHPIPASVQITPRLGDALEGATDVLLVVPSHHCRRVLSECRQFLTPRMSFCSASKGIENDTLMTVSQVIREVFGSDSGDKIAALSGPSFADEVASGHPTAVVVASSNPEMAARLQARMSVGTLRVYTNNDLMGVELGGALKNVIAIAAGAVEGLGYGSNTVAALITRGLAEISRLGVALGGRAETLAGLAGLGDLVLTCTGRLSRNRALGAALAEGAVGAKRAAGAPGSPAATPLTLAQLQAATPMVAEGVRTTLSAHRIALREGVDMPITGQVHAVLYGEKSLADAIRELLGRQLTKEDH